ncbi:MAG: 50S ribosomal protein L22 [Nitrospirae bacterium GWC2_46_6]|nr:MAG: 50S ribosomal protein L22 [Nitrospirae bacterium GWC2_46_6]OGW20684.1 MAG: 50S ribosomal protein L22 [Nitrospirae bacterium GWA2_46_11]OGW24684.1 MAG: 50S ribosomal protein L22 [Nitrospirae bacterium GWB2_47_37]HAK88102.1 50S ribosomal protein L22 [Nitrospiraceae bacterium]HCL80912.1 50S ribosomal protein L22 [Nitrospiraceae bacterium]
MESKAILKYARITPRKARRVVDLIRGKRASDAMVSLKYMPYRGAVIIAKLLRSAMANAEHKDSHVDMDKLKIKTVFVDHGPVMKRMEPRAMGRANVIKKRMSHITIILTEE